MKLAIVNITDFLGCIGATHIYGEFIITDDKDVTLENVTDFAVRYLGDKFSLEQPLTLKEAQKLDKDDGNDYYHRLYMKKETLTERFENEKQLIKSAKLKYKKLKLNCPMIILYDGDRFEGTQVFYLKEI